MRPRRFPNAIERDRLRVLCDSTIDCEVAVDDARHELASAEQDGNAEWIVATSRALDQIVALRNRAARDLGALVADLVGAIHG